MLYPPRGLLSLSVSWVCNTFRPLKMLFGHRDLRTLFRGPNKPVVLDSSDGPLNKMALLLTQDPHWVLDYYKGHPPANLVHFQCLALKLFMCET